MQKLIKELRDPVITANGVRTPTAIMLRAAKTIEHLANLNDSAARALQQLQTREMTIIDDVDPAEVYRKAMNEDYTIDFT
jgi:hypothetical protein